MKIDDVHVFRDMGVPKTTEDQERIYERFRALGIDPSEIYQELEMSSRFVNTHRDISHSSAMISLHSHDYYEVIYCRSSGVEYLVGTERYRLRAGDIVFVRPGVSHRPILADTLTEPYVRDVIWLSQEFMDRIKAAFPTPEMDPGDDGGVEPIRTAGTRWEQLGEMFSWGVQEEERKRPGWECAVIGNTMTILALLNRIHREEGGRMKAERPELLDRLAAYVDRHYSEHINVSDLARYFYVSESSVSHLFKQKMGVSIYRYITQRRLIAAKLLIRQHVPLEDVAHRVGFGDYSTFYRAFKREYGISPKKFLHL